jgi:predicted permease
MRITLPRTYQDEVLRAAAFSAIEERVRSLPGVDAAGLSADLPLANDYQGTTLTIEGEPPPADGTNLVHFSYVTPGWFDAMGIGVVSGRGIDESDIADSELTIVVNAAAARLYFDGDPIGRRILFGGGSRRVVGVVGDVRLESIADDATPAMYVPYYQSPGGRGLSLVLRTRTDATTLTASVRDGVREVDAGIPISDVRTMDDVVSDALASPRFSSVVLIAFSLAALFLAAIGIYGVISYATSMRVREIGVRMALGARPADALSLVIRHALRLALAGVAVGVAAALIFTRFLSSLLFGVRPTDPLTLAIVSLFLVAVAVLAGGAPAWRASRVDPLEALRYE